MIKKYLLLSFIPGTTSGISAAKYYISYFLESSVYIVCRNRTEYDLC